MHGELADAWAACRTDCPQKYAMRMDEVSCRTVRMSGCVNESVCVCVCECVCVCLLFVVSNTVISRITFSFLILHLSAPPLPVLFFLRIGWASNTQT